MNDSFMSGSVSVKYLRRYGLYRGTMIEKFIRNNSIIEIVNEKVDVQQCTLCGMHFKTIKPYVFYKGKKFVCYKCVESDDDV